MTDAAIKSHPKAINLSPPFMVEWARFTIVNDGDRRARVEYVRAELERAAAAGYSPLYAAITLPLEMQQNDAFEALRDIESSYHLRLVEGCSPPHCDPQGRELDEADRGKVLVAKVGLRSYPNGPARNAAGRRDADLDRVVRITHGRTTPVGLEEAITIMRRWGYNVRPRRVARVGQAQPRDEWLVVHVRDTGEPYAPPAPREQREPTAERVQGRR